MGIVTAPLGLDTNAERENAAHHEAGIVAAAVLGLALRSLGMMVDSNGAGIAYFWKKPEVSDSFRERVIIAIFAGAAAQTRFCQWRGCPEPDSLGVTLSGDSREARGFETRLSSEYLSDRSIPAINALLTAESERVVYENWVVIEAVACKLLSQDWVDVAPLKVFDDWSKAEKTQRLSGEALVDLFALYGISARLEPEAKSEPAPSVETNS